MLPKIAFAAGQDRNICVTVFTMTKQPTGAEKYFADRMLDPVYRAEHGAAAERIRSTDAIVRALDECQRPICCLRWWPGESPRVWLFGGGFWGF